MMRGNSGKGKMLIIIAMAVLIVVCAVLGVAVLGKKHHKGKPKVEKGPTTMVSIGEMVVNLADTDEIRYLKTDIVLEVSGKMPESGGEGEEGNSGAKTPLRDAIIGVLSSKRFAELNQPDGKEKIKKEITTASNKRLKEAKVECVYFNEFAMQ